MDYLLAWSLPLINVLSCVTRRLESNFFLSELAALQSAEIAIRADTKLEIGWISNLGWLVVDSNLSNKVIVITFFLFYIGDSEENFLRFVWSVSDEIFGR